MVINKHFKYIARIIVWGIIGFHIGLAILLNIPVVQKKMATLVSSELEKVLNTEVSIGHVELGLFNRIHVEDVLLNDLDGEEFLKVNRLSARFELTPLFKGKIVINSVQLIGFNAHLKKDTPESIPNFQFVLDAFASKDTLKKSPNLDLRINSVLINHGNLTYDVLSEAETPGIFNSSHVEIQNLSTSIVLKTFQNDSLNATIRRIEFHEKSGFNLKKVGLKVTANNKHLKVKDFIIQLPNSTFKMDSLNVHYDNLHNIFKTVKNTSFSGQMNAALFLPDLSSICPALKNFTSTLNYSANLEGKGKDIILSQISLLDNQNIKLAGSLSISDWDKGQNMYIQANLTHLYLTSTGIQHLMTSLTESVPSIIPQMEYIQTRAQLNGFINDLKFFANIKSNIGQLSSNILMRIDKEGNQTYSGILNGVDFNWGKLLGDKKIGLSNFNITLEGGNYKNQHPETYIKGVVSSIDYNNYRYENIFLDGNYKNGGFSGYLSLDDKNGKIQINGFFNPTQPLPHFNLCASISQLRPHELKISNKHIDSDLSLNLKADFIGRSINDMKGYILLDSLVLNAPLNKRYFLDSLSIIADKYKGENRIQVKSSFMEAIIQGNYSYSTIPTSILQTIQQYIPTLRLSNNRTIIPANNDFKFEFQLKNAELFKNLFYIPIEMHIPSTLKGHIDDPNRKLRIEGSFPQMTYNGTLYESVSFICENPTDYFQCQLRGSILMNSGAMLNLALDAKAEQNYLNTTLNWGNNTNITYGGRIATRTHFFCNEDKSPKIKANVEILPTTIVLNDTVWNIHSSHIDIDSDKIHINKFLFERPGQHLSINGTIAKNPIDTCIINLENIDIQYVLDIVQFDDVEFGGLATGKATLKNLLNSPDLHTHLKVHDFTVNKGIMGEADIEGVWDNNLPGIQLKAKMIEKDISSTKVTGFVSPKLKALDLNIVANKTNLNLLAPYFDGIFSELDGRATGLVRLYGGFKTLDFEGGVSVNLNTKIDVLNTHLHIPNDSVYISPGKFILKNARIFDKEGNSGNISGSLIHTNLKDLTYHFEINGNNLLMYNTNEPGDMLFHGQVYGNGHISIDGGNNAMNIEANLTTGPKTSFTYVTGLTTEATSNQFITFVDKTPKRTQDSIKTDFYHYTNTQKKHEEKGPSMDLHINMLVDVTPNANMKVIMDPASGDYITARGNGNFKINYYNKGDFQMFGNYVIDKGMYKLSMQEIIRKDFTLNSGSSITFAGDPYQANLDVQAIYSVNSVSLSDLSTDASLNQSTVKVNCLMNLSGSLANPTIKFDLELPTVSEEDQELVRSATSTEEQMNTQIIYLLGIGKFYTYNYSEDTYQSSNATSSLAFNTLSGQLNNMLSQVMENKNWDFGANFSTGQQGWNDVEAEAILSGRLLNNRLLINGNFGYRENVLSNTNFIGDFEAIWLLTKNGEFRLRGYNQTNDRYFTRSTLTTQGIGFIYKKDFDKWSNLFRRYMHKQNLNKNKEKK